MLYKIPCCVFPQTQDLIFEAKSVISLNEVIIIQCYFPKIKNVDHKTYFRLCNICLGIIPLTKDDKGKWRMPILLWKNISAYVTW